MGTSHVDWVPPESFDEYRLVRPLGRGSMGQVWLAHDTVLDRLVAVKFLFELGHDAARERFSIEARAAARVQHPNIIAIYRVGEIDRRPYLISEYVQGESLDRIAQPVAWPRLLEIARGLARGLAAAHQRGVLHRDLKPANAIASNTGEIKLLDFGLAKLARAAVLHHVLSEPRTSDPAGQPTTPPGSGPSSAEPSAPAPRTIELVDAVTVKLAMGAAAAPPDAENPPAQRTITGTVMGTPAYTAPEIWRAEPATPRSDVYSLGALLHELASGAPPHAGDTQEAVRTSVLETDARPLATAAPGIAPAFAAIIDRCLRRDPDERFADGGALSEAIEALSDPAESRRHDRALRGDDHSRGNEQRARGKQGDAAPRAGDRAWREDRGESRQGDGVVRDGERAGSGDADARLDAASGRGAARRRLGWSVLGAVLAVGAAIGLARVGHRVRRGGGAARAVRGAAGRCPDDMVAVPGGAFQMGSPEGAGDPDEHPQRAVKLSGYCIDRTEVTVAAYAACAAAGACSAPPRTVHWTSYSPDGAQRYGRWCNGDDRPDHPINCVDWEMASAYCAWRDRRLPSEAEWEYAARGGDDRLYPWGNEPPSALRLDLCGRECAAAAKRELDEVWVPMYDADDGWATTAPVGSFPAGASRFGALDMAGNVWEWTADWYGPYAAAPETDPQGPAAGTSRVSRGGGWATRGPNKARAADRNWIDPQVRDCDLGFRCALGD